MIAKSVKSEDFTDFNADFAVFVEIQNPQNQQKLPNLHQNLQKLKNPLRFQQGKHLWPNERSLA